MNYLVNILQLFDCLPSFLRGGSIILTLTVPASFQVIYAPNTIRHPRSTFRASPYFVYVFVLELVYAHNLKRKKRVIGFTHAR